MEDTSQFNEESDEGYFLELDVQYPENLHNINNDLPFLPEWMKIKRARKLLGNLYDKTEYVIHIINLKHTLNHGLIFKKIS